MYRYDAGEHPPAAIIPVRVADPVTGNQTSLSGKLDTAADSRIAAMRRAMSVTSTVSAAVWQPH